MILSTSNLKNDRQQERLKYIDLCAYVFGSIKRKMLMERFGISGVYASKDLAQYQADSNNSLIYESTLKQYVPTDWFTPLYEHDVNSALLLASKGVQYLKCEPETYKRFCENDTPHAILALAKIAPALRATYRVKKAEIEYISRSSGKSKRLVVPHSVVGVGNFYYLRAFDHKSGEFRNFKLNRITDSYFCKHEPAESMLIEADKQWQSILNVRLEVNKKLEHPEAIEIDYGLKKGSLTVSIREAMLHYFLMDWNIAPLGYSDLPAELFPLQVSSISP